MYSGTFVLIYMKHPSSALNIAHSLKVSSEFFIMLFVMFWLKFIGFQMAQRK